MVKARDSQFELLRIVAMLFIVTHHLVIKGADTVGYVTPYDVNTHGIAGVIINSMVVGGVNLFVLITGWYGIKHIGKGFIRLLVDCAVFGMLSYGLLVLLSDRPFTPKEMIISMMFTKNWFVVAYMMLLLVSPMIEKSLEGISSKQLLYWLMLLTVFNLYFGFYLGKVNNNGYNVVHFAWLYYIARYLRMTKDERWNKQMQKAGLWIYFGNSLLMALVFIFMSNVGHPIASMKWFSYNNPLLMLSAIGFFIWISQFKFKSHLINLIATGMFGVFLLHTTPYVIPFRNVVSKMIFERYGYIGLLSEAFSILFILSVIGVIVNVINITVINKINEQEI